MQSKMTKPGRTTTFRLTISAYDAEERYIQGYEEDILTLVGCDVPDTLAKLTEQCPKVMKVLLKELI